MCVHISMNENTCSIYLVQLSHYQEFFLSPCTHPHPPSCFWFVNFSLSCNCRHWLAMTWLGVVTLFALFCFLLFALGHPGYTPGLVPLLPYTSMLWSYACGVPAHYSHIPLLGLGSQTVVAPFQDLIRLIWGPRHQIHFMQVLCTLWLRVWFKH